jgi:hypothetical protein
MFKLSGGFEQDLAHDQGAGLISLAATRRMRILIPSL